MSVAPPSHLCDLVDAAAHGILDRAAWTTLDASLCDDRITPEETAVLALLADVVAEHAGPNRFAGRMQGMRRRQRVSHHACEVLVEWVRRLTGHGILLGDLAAARAFYTEPGVRVVRSSVLCLDITRRHAHRIAEAVSAERGVTLIGGYWPVLEIGGARLILHRSLSTAFDVAAIRARVDDRPELVMYDSLVRAAQGGPHITWYADAVAGRDRIDWELVWQIADIAGWTQPVSLASRLLVARGWSVPVHPAGDPLLLGNYWRARGRLSRRTWLVARLASLHARALTGRRHARVPPLLGRDSNGGTLVTPERARPQSRRR